MFDAILANWSMSSDHRISGIVSRDSKTRFNDGDRVTTSPVHHISRTNEGLLLANTRNTTYLLV